MRVCEKRILADTRACAVVYVNHTFRIAFVLCVCNRVARRGHMQHERAPKVQLRPLDVETDVINRMTRKNAASILAANNSIDDASDPQAALADAYQHARATTVLLVSRYLQLHAENQIKRNTDIVRLYGEVVATANPEKMEALMEGSRFTKTITVDIVPGALSFVAFRHQPNAVERWPFDPMFNSQPNARIELRNDDTEAWLISLEDISEGVPIVVAQNYNVKFA